MRIQRLMTGLLLAASLLLSQTLIAQAKYKPRPGRPPKGPMTTTAGRGVCYRKPLIVRSLEPQDHIAEFGQTAKLTSTLTFAWSIDNPEDATQLNLEVRLYSSGETGKFISTLPVTQITKNRWIATLTQALEPDRYTWLLANKCNGESRSITSNQAFDVGQLSAKVETAIAAAKTPEQRSSIYAEAGFWYNALDEALLSQQPQTLADLLADIKY
jgi:Domain of Unknown Function (DUF928)